MKTTENTSFALELIASRKFAIKNATGETVTLPTTEYAVLLTLASLGKPSHGPSVAAAAEGQIPLSTVYSSLRRLQKKGLAASETQEFEIASSTVRRTLWRATVTVPQAPRMKGTVNHDPLTPFTETPFPT